MKFPTQAHHGWTFSSMMSKTNFQPLESTSKAYFKPLESISKTFSTQAHHGWTFTFMLSKTNLKPLESTSKAYFQPHKSTSKGLNIVYWNIVKARIELLWDQLTSLQLFWWLPKITFNPWEYFQSLSSSHESTSKGLNIALVLIKLAQWSF